MPEKAVRKAATMLIVFLLSVSSVAFNVVSAEPDGTPVTEWDKTYGGTGDDVPIWMICTDDGGYAIVGYTDSFGAGRYDFWLVKTDSAGNMQWNKTYGGTNEDMGCSLVQTDDGGYAIVGETRSFGAGGYDFWLVKTDSAGNMQWNKTYGGAGYDGDPWSLVQTDDGGFAMSGWTNSFGAGGYDAWLVKTDSSGTMQWNRTYGGTNEDMGWFLAQTVDGGYAIVGYTDSFGAGGYDFWLIKLAPDRPPVVDAGEDKFVSFGDIVTLDGSTSFDLEDPTSSLSFHWSQVETLPDKPFTSVAMTGSETPTVTFTAPSVVETLTFRLTVTDTAGNSASDDVRVTVFEDLSHAIFVSPTWGDDSHPDAGTMEHPFQTLRNAVAKAQQTDGSGRRFDLYLSGGYYSCGDFTVELLDDMSLYGGFVAYRSGDSTVQGWTRTSHLASVIYGNSETMVRVEQQNYPLTIDGVAVASYSPWPAGSRKSVAGEGFYITNYGQHDVNEVWLWTDRIEVQDDVTCTLLISDLSTYQEPVYDDDVLVTRYHDEVRVYLPKLHDPSNEPNISPYYFLEYNKEIIMGRWMTCWTNMFAPQVHHLEGWEILRETIMLFDEGFENFEQVLRGPDGELYLYRPWTPGWFQGHPEVPEHGPIRLDVFLGTGPNFYYDRIREGLPGTDSIAIEVIKCNKNLRITNNIIHAGSGGGGGNGDDGGDGGAMGDGGAGGDSIGILVENGWPTIRGNTISTGQGGTGGYGYCGGNGGNSFGIEVPCRSYNSIPYENNTFQIGSVGLGGVGYYVPGNDGRAQNIYPSPPTAIIVVPPSSYTVAETTTTTTTATISQSVAQATFTSKWKGSDVVMTLIAPSGRIITRETTDPDVTHIIEGTTETYIIANPEPGEWIIQLYGADVPESGEEVTVAISGIADLTPPETTLLIGSPQYINGTGSTFVNSNTPFTLTAADYYEVNSGIATTAYRVRNQNYDTGWITYTGSFYLTELYDGTYFIDYNSTDNAGNIETTKTTTVILDNTPPKTSLTIDEPKYATDTCIYVTPNNNFTLQATDTGSGVQSFAYRIYNNTYDSDWKVYTTTLGGHQVQTTPICLNWLTDGTYTMAYNSTDMVGNKETTHLIKITIFSWNYIFEDTYGRDTILKINTAHTLFQFITPDKDYGIRNATYMQVCGRDIIIRHYDSELRLITTAVDTQLDFCVALAWDAQTYKRYYLIDKVGIE